MVRDTGYSIYRMIMDWLNIHSLNRSWSKSTAGSRKWMACLQNGLFSLSSWSWGWFITSSLQRGIWYCTLRYRRWYVLDPKDWIFECENSLFKCGVALRESDRIWAPPRMPVTVQGLWVFFSSKSQPKPLFANVTRWGVNATNLKLATSVWKKKGGVESGKSWWFTLSGDVQVCGVSASILDDLARNVIVIKVEFKMQDQLAKQDCDDVSYCDDFSFPCRPANSQMMLQISFNQVPYAIRHVYLQTWRQSDIPQFMGI